MSGSPLLPREDALAIGGRRIDVMPMGDAAVLVEFGDQIDRAVHEEVRSLADYLDAHPLLGMIEYTAAFTTLALYYDPLRTSYPDVIAGLKHSMAQLRRKSEIRRRTVEIPVCYGGEFGPDLAFVGQHHRLSVEEVVQIHCGVEYLTFTIGFSPGFPYLGGMSERIATPRRATPRLLVPAGSVGIAGCQTGVYPIATPGGWQLIGRTPHALFRPWEDPPSLLCVGDLVRFRPIDRQEFEAWQEADG